jgi:hypothetical protein
VAAEARSCSNPRELVYLMTFLTWDDVTDVVPAIEESNDNLQEIIRDHPEDKYFAPQPFLVGIN